LGLPPHPWDTHYQFVIKTLISTLKETWDTQYQFSIQTLSGSVKGGSIPAVVEDVGFVLYLPTQSDVRVSDDGSQVMDPGMRGNVLCSPIAHGGPGFFKPPPSRFSL